MELSDLLSARVTALTGAGMSTASGIPDYRGPGKTTRRPPIQHREFVTSAPLRARYWARAVLGWPRFRAFEPNAAHRALAQLEHRGVVAHLITQNVDGLHQRAGHRDVLELHGTLSVVRCLSCGDRVSRDDFQARLLELNPRARDWSAALRPDGDADLDDALVADFHVPDCHCGGLFKPDVVFFGDNVPAPRLEQALAKADDAQVLLVLGSSLTVYSGFRFVLRAKERGQRVVIVNQGATRGDELADLKLDADVGTVLARLT